MNLSDVNRGIKKNKKRTRIGRGTGSGHGKTSGRGHKGQGQLAGWSAPSIFEGGRMPLIRRVPKRGFNNQWARVVAAVNLGDLDKVFQKGDDVTPETIRSRGLAVGRYDQLKILGNGELTKPLKISAHRFSKSALEKVQKAGGETVTLPGPKPVARPERKKKAKAATT
jgi:large subunit ribosomal protein L15